MPVTVALHLTAAERAECLAALENAAANQDAHQARAPRWPCSGEPFRKAAALLANGDSLPRLECRFLLNATPRGAFRDRLVSLMFIVGA